MHKGVNCPKALELAIKLKREYFNNKDFNGPALYKGVDTVLDVNWKDRAPREDMDDDDFQSAGQVRSGLHSQGFTSSVSSPPAIRNYISMIVW